MVNEKRCPICKNIAKQMLSKGDYKIYRCNLCGLGHLEPIPTTQFLKKFYREEYFQKKSNEFGYKNYTDMSDSLKAEALRKIRLISKFCKKNVLLLDVGSGPGDFANAAKDFGFETEVLDVSAWAINIAKKSGLKGYVSDLSDKTLPRKFFSIVTAWDVVEHFNNPLEGMRSLNKLLSTEGFLFLTTPNLEAFDSKVLGKNWYGFKKIPEHILYLSPKSMRFLAKKTGFEVVDIKIWGFVRDLDFVSEKIYDYNKFVGILMAKAVKFLKLGKVNIYLPITDMMVILRKEKNEISS